MQPATTTIYVCTTCRGVGDAEARPGKQLLDALRERLSRRPEQSVKVEAVACLQVCKRPATVALAGAGKWTYTMTEFDAARDVDDLLLSARLHAEAADGVAAWKDRPVCFRKNVVSRTPPLGFAGRED